MRKYYFYSLRTPRLEIYANLSDNLANDDIQSRLMGKTIGMVFRGTFQFDSLVIYGHANTTFNLRIYPNFLERTTPFPDFSMKNEIVSNNRYFYYFPLKLMTCSSGQILKRLLGTNLTYCFSCTPGTYTLKMNEPYCKVCPDGADCSTGILIVNSGFWRIGEEVHACFPTTWSCLSIIYYNYINLQIFY